MVLMLHPVSGGKQERLTAPPQTSLGDYVAKFSKNGKHIAFLRYVGDSAGQIWIMDLDSRASRKIVQLSGIPPLNIDFINDDKEIIYPSSNASIISVDVNTSAEKLLFYTESLAHEIFVTNDERFFVSVGNVRKTNVSKQSNPFLNTHQTTQLIFHSSRNDTHAIANPIHNGPLAVYSNRSGLPQIWLYFEDGKQIQLSKFTESYDLRNLEFSSDGQSLLANIGNSIWVFSLDKPPVQISNPDQIVLEPSWSSDSKFIYFTVSKEGRWQIVRTRIDSKVQEVVSSEFDFYRESPDGKYIVFRKFADGNYKLKLLEKDLIIDLPINNTSYLHPNFVLRDSHIYFTEQLGDDTYAVKGFYLSSRIVKDSGILMKNSLRSFTVSRDENYIYLQVGNYDDVDIAELKFK
jgi:Tol biopolymer transport system component